MREACIAISQTCNIINPEFTPKGAHENSDKLRELIQSKINDTVETDKYDAILLGFGLCGNATAGLKASNIPLVIPRAHDCCTIFLGSKNKFIEYFKDNLSKEWSSTGYMERGDSYLRESDVGKSLGIKTGYEEFVDLYGEENAEYLWETLHPEAKDKELIYIEIEETAHLGYCQKIRAMADKEGKTVKVLEGDMGIIRNLINGDWDAKDFLVVPPGKSMRSHYDFDQVISILD